MTEEAELEKTKNFQNEAIILEYAAKYNPTKREALLMYAQYWNEHVVRKMAIHENDGIGLNKLGVLSPDLKKTKSKIQKLIRAKECGSEFDKLNNLYNYAYRLQNQRSLKVQFKKINEAKKRSTKERILFFVHTPW